MIDEQSEEKMFLENTKKDYISSLEKNLKLSGEVGGKIAVTTDNYACSVYFSICSIGMVMADIARSYAGPTGISHVSLCSLSRTLIDHAIMLRYLVRDYGNIELCEFKIDILGHQDTTNRMRLFGKTDAAEKEVLRKKRDLLRERIEKNINRNSLTDDQVRALDAGSLTMICSSRELSAELGVEKDRYNSIFSYLSAFVHGHPISFMRIVKYNVSSEETVPYVAAVAGFALESSILFLDACFEQMSIVKLRLN